MSETTTPITKDITLTPDEKAYLLSCFRIGNLLLKNARNPLVQLVLGEMSDYYSSARAAITAIIGVPLEKLANGKVDVVEAKDRLNTSLHRIIDSLQ